MKGWTENSAYMDQSVKLILDKGESQSVKTGEKLHKDAVCHRFYLYSE